MLEAPKSSGVSRVCKGFEAFGKGFADRLLSHKAPEAPNAQFCEGFVKNLKHLKKTWQIGCLSHEAPEAPKCSVL